MTKRYDEYKDSGIEWLGVIPNQWNLTRVKNVAKQKTETKNILNDNEFFVPLEGVEKFTGKIIKKNKTLDNGNNSFKSGDVCINKLRPYLNKVINPDFSGACSNEMVVLRTFSDFLDSRYLFYYMLNSKYIMDLNNLVNGAKMPRLSPSEINNSLISIPKKTEQQAIADYLDNKTSKIDSAVAELEKQRSLLIELKKSTIHQAVTKGLDLTVPMKDSGVEWIGEVAKGFKTLKLKNIIVFYNGYSFTDEDLSDNETGSFLIRIGNLKANGTLDPYKSPRYLKNTPSKFKIENDSILMALSGATAGKAVYFDNCEEDLYLNQRVAKIKSYSENLKYLYYYLSLDEVTVELMNIAKITTHPNFSKEHIMNLTISIPQKTKQDEIVAYLDKKTGQIDQSIEVIDNQIAKMKEYKKTLINDVVTGKIKVV